jgi:uncharacterized protein (DUF58 family)
VSEAAVTSWTGRREASWRRRLKVTRSGAALLVLTLAVGFAAFNTGNNLLFFGWGLMLSSIVVSGILSESTLRAVRVEPHPPSELRVGVPSALPFVVENTRGVPSFAVEVQALFPDAARSLEGARAFVLRVAPGTRAAADLAVAPRKRGRVVIDRARVFTSFPFGFFEKERRVPLEPPMSLVVFPRRVDVGQPLADLLTRLGEAPARRPGAGDEIFSLRPFRAGDDPRRIAWRRTAKTGRVVVKETEAARSHDVMLELAFTRDTTPEDLDRACALCGSLAEDLLAAGHAVGLRAGRSALVPAVGPRQRGAILGALAVVEPTDDDAPALTVRRAVVVAVVARGASPSARAAVALHASDGAAAGAAGGAADGAADGAA